MSNTTTNYGFTKPSYSDFADISVLDNTFEQIDTTLKEIENRAIITQTATGTGTAITLTINQTLVNGLSVTFIASANNSGNATTINGKPLYKPNTTTVPNLVAGKAYTVWYNSTGNCFFIKASAEGDVIASQVLAGKKFSNDSDTGLTGTMQNNGTLNYSLPINGIYNIPSGYTTGGSITQNIPVKTAQTYTPSTSNQTISLGQYLSGNQVILGDSDLLSSNIVSTANIFGVQGNATIESLGGRTTEVKNFTINGAGHHDGSTAILTFNSVPILITGLFYNGTMPAYFTFIATNSFGLPSHYFITLDGDDVSGSFGMSLTGTSLSIHNPFYNDMLNGTAVAIC